MMIIYMLFSSQLQ